MATNEQSGSARIYQFPARGRFAAREDSSHADKAIPAPHAAIGGAWYHDEAIQAEGLRKSSYKSS